MKKKERRRCRKVDEKYGLKKYTTERIKCGIISPTELKEGLRRLYARSNFDDVDRG